MTSRRWQAFRLALVILTQVWSISAHADEYRSALAHGVESRDRALETNTAEDWREALDAFADASRLSFTKEARFEFAETATHLNLDDEAVQAYSEALALGLSGKADERARAFIDSHKEQMGQLEIEGPPGAVIRVRARVRGTLPLARSLFITPGEVLVHIEAPRFKSWETKVTVQAGKATHIQATLAPSTAESRPSHLQATRSPRITANHKISASTWGGPVLIAGGSLAGVGAVTILTSSALLPGARASLAKNCTAAVEDECLRVVPGGLGSAQDAANKAARLKALRWGAAWGATVGVTAAAVGAVRLMAEHRPSAEPETANNTWSLPALLAGGGLVALGMAAVFTADDLLSAQRYALAQSCAMQSGDTCVATTENQRTAAQSANNKISALTTVRWIGAGTAAIGIGAMAAGSLGIFSDGHGLRTAFVDLQVSPNELQLRWQVRF